jgi:hypothetical protein
MRGGRPLRRPATLRGVWGDCGEKTFRCGATPFANRKQMERMTKLHHDDRLIVPVEEGTGSYVSRGITGHHLRHRRKWFYRLDRSTLSVSNLAKPVTLLKCPPRRDSVRPHHVKPLHPFHIFVSVQGPVARLKRALPHFQSRSFTTNRH